MSSPALTKVGRVDLSSVDHFFKSSAQQTVFLVGYRVYDIPEGYRLLDHVTKVKATFLRPNITTGRGKKKKVTKAAFTLDEVIDISPEEPDIGYQAVLTKLPVLNATRAMAGFVCKNPAKRDIANLTLQIFLGKGDSKASISSQWAYPKKCDQLVTIRKLFKAPSGTTRPRPHKL